MGCLKLNDRRYERRIIEMSKKKDDTKRNKTTNSENDQESYAVPKTTISFIKWVLGGCGALFILILGVVGWMGKQLFELNKKVITDDSSLIADMKQDVKDINQGLNGNNGIYSRLSIIEDRMNISAIKASVETQKYVDDISVADNNISISTSSISSNTCIGTDSDGKAYIAKDLIDQTILLTFVQDNKEIYFLGQYNKNYHWDGYCITNSYNLDDSLSGICESDFDDGERLDYKSFYMSEIQDEWIYTDRVCKNGLNDGISIRYQFAYNKSKNFTTTNARVSDILFYENFEDSDNKKILSCYKGTTSNGLYNDSTGNAYLIKYNKNGFVKMFYKGNFKNGNFEDKDAFEIVLDESNGINKYFIYKGSFVKGNRENDNGIKYITQEEIKEIMKKNKCPSNLKWYNK